LSKESRPQRFFNGPTLHKSRLNRDFGRKRWGDEGYAMEELCAELGAAFLSKNTSITLGNHFASFVEQQVSEGRYGSVSEVVRAGLRLLEEHETKLATLRSALAHGEESGPAVPFDIESFLDGKRKAGSG
jgi:antitoxin ParD1/3/4